MGWGWEWGSLPMKCSDLGFNSLSVSYEYKKEWESRTGQVRFGLSSIKYITLLLSETEP